MTSTDLRQNLITTVHRAAICVCFFQAISNVHSVEAVQALIVPLLETLLRGDDLLDEATKYMCNAMLKERGVGLEADAPMVPAPAAKQQTKFSSMMAKVRGAAPTDAPAECGRSPSPTPSEMSEAAFSEAGQGQLSWKERMAQKFKRNK